MLQRITTLDLSKNEPMVASVVLNHVRPIVHINSQ